MAKEPNTKTKTRRVKNPESFRDKAVKASAQKPKKQHVGRVTNPIRKGLAAVVKPFKTVGHKVGQTRTGKFIKQVLHILAIILFISYVRNSFKELKQVTWPNWRQSWKLTYAVLAFAIVFGAAIAGLDWVLGKIFKQILIK
jgi:preprotein translocase SecE subunit